MLAGGRWAVKRLFSHRGRPPWSGPFREFGRESRELGESIRSTCAIADDPMVLRFGAEVRQEAHPEIGRPQVVEDLPCGEGGSCWEDLASTISRRSTTMSIRCLPITRPLYRTA